MKTGKATIEAITIWCPECDEFVTDSAGSSLLNADEYDKLPKTITCFSCGEKFRKPTVTWLRKGRQSAEPEPEWYNASDDASERLIGQFGALY